MTTERIRRQDEYLKARHERMRASSALEHHKHYLQIAVDDLRSALEVEQQALEALSYELSDE